MDSEVVRRRIASFEEQGEAQVRDKIAMRVFNDENRALAVRWLESKDQEREAASRARSEASQDEQIKVARSAKNAAWAAAIAAMVAAVVAIIAAVISYFAWSSPHQ